MCPKGPKYQYGTKCGFCSSNFPYGLGKYSPYGYLGPFGVVRHLCKGSCFWGLGAFSGQGVGIKAFLRRNLQEPDAPQGLPHYYMIRLTFPIYYSSFHFSIYPNITPIYSSFHFLLLCARKFLPLAASAILNPKPCNWPHPALPALDPLSHPESLGQSIQSIGYHEKENRNYGIQKC